MDKELLTPEEELEAAARESGIPAEDEALAQAQSQSHPDPTILLGGKEPGPFNALRRSAAQAMGMRWGRIVPSDMESIEVPLEKDGEEPGAPETVTIVTYPGMVDDVTIVSWLLVQPVSVVVRATRDRACAEAAKIEAYNWAEKHGIVYPGTGYLTALAVVMDAFNAEARAAVRKK